jgi:hypothetical protein
VNMAGEKLSGHWEVSGETDGPSHWPSTRISQNAPTAGPGKGVASSYTKDRLRGPYRLRCQADIGVGSDRFAPQSNDSIASSGPAP